MGAGPAASDLCGQAARGWPHALGLQHPEGVDAAPGAPPARWQVSTVHRVATTLVLIMSSSGLSSSRPQAYYAVDIAGARTVSLTRGVLAVDACAFSLYRYARSLSGASLLFRRCYLHFHTF